MLTCDTYCHTWYSLWHIRYTRSVHDNKCRMWAFIRVRCITSLFHTWHIFTSYYAHVDMAATAFKHSDFKTSFSIKETVLNYNCVSRCTIMMYPLKYFETNVSAFRIKQSLHIDELQNFIWFFLQFGHFKYSFFLRDARQNDGNFNRFLFLFTFSLSNRIYIEQTHIIHRKMFLSNIDLFW